MTFRPIGVTIAAMVHRLGIHPGNRVYDVADPRHVGRVKCITINEGTATIRWEETGWLSVRWPLAGLRKVELGDDR